MEIRATSVYDAEAVRALTVAGQKARKINIRTIIIICDIVIAIGNMALLVPMIINKTVNDSLNTIIFSTVMAICINLFIFIIPRLNFKKLGVL